MKVVSVVGMERPPFGYFARQIALLRQAELAECLERQRLTGERLGRLLWERGLLTREQIQEILRQQSKWVATAVQGDMGPGAFPRKEFLSLCMPAFNEEGSIADTLDAALAILPELMSRFEIIVVNDGSRDRTADIVRLYTRQDDRVRLVQHETNRGYGAAVSTGLRAAAGDLVAFTDSDGQFSLLDLPQLLLHIEDKDVAIGYRYLRADNGLRRFNAWAWNRLVGLLLGIHVRDLDCAFKLFRREVVERLCLTATGACISAEIMVQCTRGGLRIGEVPVTHYPRYQGVPSGAAIKVIWRAFRELPSLWRYRHIAPLVPAPFPSLNGKGANGQATKGTPLDAVHASETEISVTSPTI
jgi:Glycosyl transferase family 2